MRAQPQVGIALSTLITVDDNRLGSLRNLGRRLPRRWGRGIAARCFELHRAAHDPDEGQIGESPER